jgi:hypothetical protein
MSGPGRFGVEELGPTEGTELDDALEAIGALERVGQDAPVHTGPAFSDRVMAALADEPVPGSVGFLFPIRRLGPVRGFTESVRQAWASVGGGRPVFARAAALAYVLVVAVAATSLVGAASFGAAGALGLLEPRQTVQPTPEATIAPVLTPPPATESPESSTEPEPTESPEAVAPSDDHGGGGEPEPSDDHGRSPGSGGGSDDGSGDSHDGSEPRETDDHGGSDDHPGGGSDDDSGGPPTTGPSLD